MIRPKQAKKRLPKAEFEQFESIIENQMGKMSEARLMQKATISRRLRDKYRDLARRQTVAAKKKLTNKTDVSQNEARAELFNALINRIETELERPSRPKRKKAAKKAARKGTTRDREAEKAIVEARRRS